MSKGSTRRPSQVSQETLATNWERTFGRYVAFLKHGEINPRSIFNGYRPATDDFYIKPSSKEDTGK